MTYAMKLVEEREDGYREGQKETQEQANRETADVMRSMLADGFSIEKVGAFFKKTADQTKLFLEKYPAS